MSNDAFYNAIYHGDTEKVKLLLQDPCVDPNSDNDYAIRNTACDGHLEMFRLLLSRVDPTVENNYAIRVASFYGHLEIVKLLLSDSRVDPCAVNNYAIRYASEYGHLEVIRLLLSDPRVDLNTIENGKIRQQLLKEEKDKLRKEFSFRYQVIQQASPQISIEGKLKSKIPSVLLRKIVYNASYQEATSFLKLLALADLLGIKYDQNTTYEDLSRYLSWLC